MKQLWWATLIVLVAGCSSNTRRSIDAMKLALHPRETVTPTAASVAAKPFFQLQAASPDGQAILILGSVEGDLLGWYGPDGQALFLERGVVVRTLGLKQNLDNMTWPSEDPFNTGLQKLTSPLQSSRTVDWSPGYRYNITLQSRLVPAGMESVDILGTQRQLRRVDEYVVAPGTKFVAENHYWVDPVDGFIWKSHQVVAPGLPLDLIQLRPYRKPQQ